MSRIAVYPGSFDPITLGHLDVIERASHLFDKVIVAPALNAQKKHMFSITERIGFLRIVTGQFGNVEVDSLDGLLVDFARAKQAVAVVRGLRAVSDFDFEFQMALMNRRLAPELETVFFTPKEDYTFLSSRIVKEIARLGGDVSTFVPECVNEALLKFPWEKTPL